MVVAGVQCVTRTGTNLMQLSHVVSLGTHKKASTDLCLLDSVTIRQLM